MKKLLQNKITLITLSSVFVVLTLIITFFCVRPTAVGYTYKGQIETGYNIVLDYSLHFHSTNKLTKTMDNGTVHIENQYWYFEHNGYIVEVGLVENYTKAEFKEKKQEIIDNWDENSQKKYNTKINAFYIKDGQEILLSVGSIVTVSILTALDITTFVFAIISLTKVVKSRSNIKSGRNKEIN